MDEILRTIFNVPSIRAVPGYETIILGIQLVWWGFVLADLVLILAFLHAFRKAWAYRPDLEVPPPNAGAAPGRAFALRTTVNQERWKGIVKKAGSETPDSLRIAVIDADALVNDVLRQMGLEGQHMADRLSQLDPEDISTLQRVWRAHRIRNDLVHTPGFFLGDQEARRALEDFEAFLREVQAI